MKVSEFRSLKIGDKVSLFPDITNTVTNVYLRVLPQTNDNITELVPVSFIEIDFAQKTPIGDDCAELLTLVSKRPVPEVIYDDNLLSFDSLVSAGDWNDFQPIN